MRLSFALISTSAAVLALAVPRLAAATETFPSALKTDLHLDYEPCCTICHETQAGGAGTVTRPFGSEMVARGLLPNDEASLGDAILEMQTDGVDSDGDGVSDLDELVAQTDPDQSGAQLDACGDSPLYGCGAHAQLASGPPVWEGALSIATAAALFATRRRRKGRNAGR